MKYSLAFLFLFIGSLNFSNAQFKYITQNAKNGFDLHKNDFVKNEDNSKGLFDWIAEYDDYWQYTLINGAYFTIGSSEGVSSGSIDDECEFTFGHPFALSSYPFPVINGYNYSPIEIMINETGQLIKNDGDLSYSVVLEGICQLEFKLSDDTPGKLSLSYTLKNISAVEQNFGMGMMYDAAVGKSDDGNLIYDDQFLETSTEISSNIQDSLVFHERKITPKGVSYCIHYTENKPNNIKVGNWQNLYYNDILINELFDLALLNVWDETIVQAGDSVYFKIEMEQLQADYDGQCFMRWDMPSVLSVENQQLFPLEINSTVEIISETESYNDLFLYTPENYNVFENISDENFDVTQGSNINFQEFSMELSEVYDSLVSSVVLKLMQGETIIDSLVRNVFIPASPYSDTGLIVNADSVFTDNDTIIIRFHVKNEETEQYIYNLHKTNIFFWEEAARIQDIKIETDTTGGTNNADIIFVIDTSGSMGDNINQVRDNIVEFGDSLVANGINFRLGMVAYCETPHIIHDFTDDTGLYWTYLNDLIISGGTENVLTALMETVEFDFRPDAARTVILLTDEPGDDFGNPYSVQDVADAFLMNGITMHCISEPYLYTRYEQLIVTTGGYFFDIFGNFRDILMTVANTDANPNYLLSYLPDEQITLPTTYTVEAHYAGLGGFDTILYEPDKDSQEDFPDIRIFPNPILNSTTKVMIDDPNAETCFVEVSDITGNILFQENEIVKDGCITIDFNSSITNSKVFLIKLVLYDNNGTNYLRSFKLISN